MISTILPMMSRVVMRGTMVDLALFNKSTSQTTAVSKLPSYLPTHATLYHSPLDPSPAANLLTSAAAQILLSY
jgi:hypothetical protein